MGSIVRNPGVPPTRQVIAGANMTGGGALTGDVTLNASASGTGGYEVIRLYSDRLALVWPVSSVAYSLISNVLQTFIDQAAFIPTQYKLILYGNADEVQTITLELRTGAGVAVHTGGNDLAVTSVANVYDSGWKTIDVALAGNQNFVIYAKGSNATVDLSMRWFEIQFKS